MYKGIFRILLLLIISNSAMANEYNFELRGESYVYSFPSAYSFDFINRNILRINWISDPDSFDYDSSKDFSYYIETKSGLPFIVLDDDIPTNINEVMYNSDTTRKYGNRFLFLVGQDPKETFGIASKFHHKYAMGYVPIKDEHNSNIIIQDIRNYEATPRKYKDASSTLVEPGFDFSINNLNNFESGKAWVEGVDGYGIGESFVIEHFNYKYDYLFIINGFISVDNPGLYKKNSRIKTIKVEGVQSNQSVICEVLDTPHPQTVDISKISNIEDLKITILDVYKGEKYQDTAIHYLITWDKEIVPYSDK